MQDDILTIEEVAKYLRVSDRTVYDWAQKGEIPAGKIGTVWRFKKSEVEALIEDWRINPPLNGELADVEWEQLPGIPELEDITSIDAHGVYHNLTEVVLTMAELSGLKPYKLVNEFGDFAGYTFEVVE